MARKTQNVNEAVEQANVGPLRTTVTKATLSSALWTSALRSADRHEEKKGRVRSIGAKTKAQNRDREWKVTKSIVERALGGRVHLIARGTTEGFGEWREVHHRLVAVTTVEVVGGRQSTGGKAGGDEKHPLLCQILQRKAPESFSYVVLKKLPLRVTFRCLRLRA